MHAAQGSARSITVCGPVQLCEERQRMSGRQSIIARVRAGCVLLAMGAIASTALSVFGMKRQEAALLQVEAATALMRNHMEADMGHDAIRAEVVSIVAARQSRAFV